MKEIEGVEEKCLLEAGKNFDLRGSTSCFELYHELVQNS